MYRGHAILGPHAQMVLGRDRVSDRESEPTGPLAPIREAWHKAYTLGVSQISTEQLPVITKFMSA